MGTSFSCCCCDDADAARTPLLAKAGGDTPTNKLKELPYHVLRGLQHVTNHKRHRDVRIDEGIAGVDDGDASPPSWPHISKPTSILLAKPQPVYDVIVVGSGYGGGIMASRLSRAGKRVCVLERGQERWPGEYPNTLTGLLAHAQVRSSVGVVGKRDAFFDFRLEEGAYVWVGCGLGGGSLVNSGVSIAPDRRVFDEDQWPAGIQKDRDTKLKDGFDRAASVLRPAQYPDQDTHPLPRVTRMQEAAAHLRETGYPAAKAVLADVNVSFREAAPNPQGVPQPACTLCGDCNTGCNVGAKNTVLMNYLPDAHNHGADIFTGVEVRYVSQAPPQEHEQAAGSAGAAKWTIECFLIGPDAPSTDPPLSFSLSANVLVLAAGTLGTNEILLRSRERASLQMSPAVGRWFGADGDFFRVGFNGESAANTLGYGSDPGGARRKAENDSVGACITSVIDLRDPAVPATQGIILEDIGLGGALSEATAVAFTDWAAVAGKPTEKDPAKLAAAKARVATSKTGGPWAKGGAMVNTVAWGGMSFDDQNGSLALEKDELRVHWSTAPGGPNPPARSDALIEVCCDTPTIKSAFCKDPLESFLGERGTIHPLGGCCLADTAATGGCNHKGQLFDGLSATSVHEGLYVSKEWSVCVDALS